MKRLAALAAAVYIVVAVFANAADAEGSTHALRMQPSPSPELLFAEVPAQSWSSAVELLRRVRSMSSSLSRVVLNILVLARPPPNLYLRG